MPAIPADQVVTTSDRPFSEEVAIVDAIQPLPLQPVVYEFAGGRRRFKERDPIY